MSYRLVYSSFLRFWLPRQSSTKHTSRGKKMGQKPNRNEMIKCRTIGYTKINWKNTSTTFNFRHFAVVEGHWLFKARNKAFWALFVCFFYLVRSGPSSPFRSSGAVASGAVAGPAPFQAHAINSLQLVRGAKSTQHVRKNKRKKNSTDDANSRPHQQKKNNRRKKRKWKMKTKSSATR